MSTEKLTKYIRGKVLTHLGLLARDCPEGYSRSVERLWLDNISPFWVWVCVMLGLARYSKRTDFWGRPEKFVGVTPAGRAALEQT